MCKIIVEETGKNAIAIHCDNISAARIYEGICQVSGEYPADLSEEQRIEKRNLCLVKKQLEIVLSQFDLV